MSHILTVEDLRSWWRRQPRARGFRHFPALSSLIRYYVRENRALTLLHADDRVTIYGPGSSSRTLSQRTHAAGSEVSTAAWRVKHREAEAKKFVRDHFEVVHITT